jgi:hypothetical protein
MYLHTYLYSTRIKVCLHKVTWNKKNSARCRATHR